jgi:transcriptional regulator with XRE-family HTH domain
MLMSMVHSKAMDIRQIFGEVLRRHRSRKNISQEELAFLAEVDTTFISRLERGIRQPTIATLIGIGQALGVSAASLVRETEKEYLRQRNQ